MRQGSEGIHQNGCNTVDGRNPKQPPGMYIVPVNNGIFTISTGAGFLPSTIGFWAFSTLCSGAAEVGFVTGRAGNFLRTIEEECLVSNGSWKFMMRRERLKEEA